MWWRLTPEEETEVINQYDLPTSMERHLALNEARCRKFLTGTINPPRWIEPVIEIAMFIVMFPLLVACGIVLGCLEIRDAIMRHK